MLPHIDYDLDVEGDVILTLENPNEPFAVWVDEGEPCELPRPLPLTLDDEVIRSFRQIDPALREELVMQDPVQWAVVQEVAPVQEELPEAAEVPEATEGAEVPAVLSNLSVQGTPEVPGRSEVEDVGNIGEEVSQIRFRLSSRHLISASPYFKAMLTGPWEEGVQASRPHSSYKISARDWDEDAFKLLMDIVHGNSQNVPRSVDLEMLAKIAVLVDYYKCYDVVKFYSDTWIEGLGDGIEVTQCSRKLVLVLFVSSIFFQRTKFRDLTCQAIRQTRGPLRSLGLPFPEGLIGLFMTTLECRDAFLTASAENIDRKREDAVGILLDGFHDLLQYLTTRNSCKLECNAVLVGSLYRQMFARGISSRPARPFHGFSVAGVSEMAWDTRAPTGMCRSNYHYYNDTCSIQKFLDPLMKHVTDSVEGLELEKYVTNPWVNTPSGPVAPSSVS